MTDQAAVWRDVTSGLGAQYDAKHLDELRDSAMFAHVGPESFLVLTSSIFLAQPSLGKLEILASAQHSDDWALPEFRSLPGGGMWALLHARGLEHGIHSDYFGAVFIKPVRAREPTVTSVNMATFEDIDANLCDESEASDEQTSEAPVLDTAQHVNGFEVKDVNHDSMDDIVFSVSEQDCKTLDISSIRRVFVNTGSGRDCMSRANVVSCSPR